MVLNPKYPTIEHERAAGTVVHFFSASPVVEAVTLTCSCARGKASRDSCLDMAVLVRPEIFATVRERLEAQWDEFYRQEDVFKKLPQVGKYSHVDLEFFDGCFVPPSHGWTSGTDGFELEIGNHLVYSVPLWKNSDYLDDLKAQWLPYYDEILRRERLAMVRRYCFNNLDHIPLYVNRGLHFQAFDRFYNAIGEFLQALFIAHRTYPIAYDKWIREQVEEILGLTELYRKLVKFFEITSFESQEIAAKAEDLAYLLNTYASE
jgi:hypothetical protein